ncbi:hypothetical protein PSM7751_02928 [Pseudooceanicola marinus]|uniref:Glyoxalase/fosfomycin resistance/dioxygenase domain-containing protein n=1 Tax=Pseudooceanicola marinus TaxID=396013 RepID=A0A1X6ZTH1_9RHOB|nr:VOC family protein [Pseudooceanicola marinus]PJE30727.1 VOC family protein [Pseudooceanicola marinus]SLN59153.1 hypothetical protein PSM7751_02928 [Pseudooceanicola marinus]
MSIYLFFNGQARSALNFYAEVLGGEVEHVLTYADMPEPPPLPREKHHWLMHGHMTSSYAEIMVSDRDGPEAAVDYMGFAIEIDDEDPGIAHHLFLRLSDRGEVILPFAPNFWAQGFGTCRDRFGVPWMINCDR